MAESTRDRMIGGAAELLAERGLLGTSFAEVVERTGAPRGSIYHHFPGGKDEMVRAAVTLIGRDVVARLDALDVETPGAVIDVFVAGWRSVLEGSDYGRGCAVAAVSIGAGADSDHLRPTAAEVFRAWHDALARALVRAGTSRRTAREVSTVAIVAVESALVVGRATREPSLFDVLRRQLRRLVD
jgi:TetR/AcrR family transcriptional repressor of lmrAB and yxaGH operons